MRLFIIILLFLSSCSTSTHTAQHHKSTEAEKQLFRDSTFIHHVTYTNTINDTVHHNTHHYHYNSNYRTDTVRLVDTIRMEETRVVSKPESIFSKMRYYVIIVILVFFMYLCVIKKL